jgi:hypothetical protein
MRPASATKQHGVHQPPSGSFIKKMRALIGFRWRMFQQSLHGLRLQQKQTRRASTTQPINYQKSPQGCEFCCKN